MRNKLLILLGLIILTVGVGIFTIIPKSFFPITRVECLIGSQQCPDTLVSALQPLISKSLFFSKLASDISHLSIAAFELTSIQKKLPGTVILHFQPKKNVCVVQLSNGEQWTVADSGYAQQQQSNEPLPIIIVSDYWTQPINDQHLDPNLQEIIQPLIENLQKYNITTTRIQFNSPTEIILTLPNNLTAIVSHENTPEQIKKLSVILKDLDLGTIDKGLKTIDLRFSFPVLKS